MDVFQAFLIKAIFDLLLGYVYTAPVQFSPAKFLLRINCIYTVPDQNRSSCPSRLHCTGSVCFLAMSMRTAGITLHAGKEVCSEKPPKQILVISQQIDPLSCP